MNLFIYLSFALFMASVSASIYGLTYHSLIPELAAIAFGILSYVALAMEKMGK